MDFDDLENFDFSDYHHHQDVGSLEKFEYYPNDDDADDFSFNDPYAYYQSQQQQFDAGFGSFCWNIILQVWPNIWITFVACLIWRLCKIIFSNILKYASPSKLCEYLFSYHFDFTSVMVIQLFLSS